MTSNSKNLDVISFKESYATGQSFIVPVALIPPLLGIGVVVWGPFLILSLVGYSQDVFLYVALTFAFLGPYVVFFYGSPWKKFGKLHQPPKVIVANQTFFQADLEKEVKPLIGTRQRKNLQGETETIHAVEDKIHLAKNLRFKFDGLDFGAYLQQNSVGQLVVVWVFNCTGIPYSLTVDQYNSIAGTLQAGLSDYSSSGTLETLTIDAEVRSDCSLALAANQKLRDNRLMPAEDLFILDGIDERIKDLARDGRIAARTLRIYATTNLSSLNSQSEDMELGDHVQAFLEKKIQSLRPPEDIQLELRDSLTQAYEKGFKRWRRLIESKLELPVSTLSHKEAWQVAWNEINDGPAPDVPHLLTISDKGLIEESDDQRMLASVLFQGKPPTLSSEYVHLPRRRNSYLGIAAMVRYPNREWDSTDREKQMTYGAALINTPSVINTRVLVQLSAVPPGKAKIASDWRVKTEASSENYRKKRQLTDVDSEEMLSSAKEAARSRKRGAVSIKWAWVAVVHRSTVSELNDAISNLTEHSSLSGRIVQRETCYCDQIWFSAMPSLSAHGLLQKATKPETIFSSFERRLENETKTTPGVLPLMKEHKLRSKGYPLVTRLKESVFLDPCGKKPHLNFILQGEKGSGKSKIIQGLIKNGLMQGGRAIIIDGARQDGSGSFDAWAKFEKDAVYFNPNRDSYNIFDAVDQRYLEPFDSEDPESLDVWGGIEAFLFTSLTELSYRGSDPELKEEFAKLHTYFVGEFYRNLEIRRLRNAAFDGGVGSPEWLVMPTLHHYLDFLNIENLPTEIRKFVNPAILEKTQGALYSLLQKKLGKAIARPTSVNFDNARLIVYAMSAIAESDMLPLGIAMSGSIQAQTNRKGLKLLVLEEAALNLRHPVLALIAAEGWAQGRKRDQHCLIVSQDVGPIVESSAGNDIIKNSEVVVVGAIVPAAVEGISTALEIPRSAVARCAEASFFPKDDEFGRNFLVHTKEGQLFVTDYSDFRSLYMVMNESDELLIKRETKRQYPDNKYREINAGAEILRSQSFHAANDT